MIGVGVIKMAYIIIQQRNQIVTQGGLTEEEQTTIKQMLKEKKTPKQIEDYLLKQDHIVIGNRTNEQKEVMVINTAFEELDIQLIFDALETLFG